MFERSPAISSSRVPLLEIAGGLPAAASAKIVIEDFRKGDYLAQDLIYEVTQALIAGTA